MASGPRRLFPTHIPGLDNQQTFQHTGAVGVADMAQAFTRRQPIVVIDARSGHRQLIWSELDANESNHAALVGQPPGNEGVREPRGPAPNRAAVPPPTKWVVSEGVRE